MWYRETRERRSPDRGEEPGAAARARASACPGDAAPAEPQCQNHSATATVPQPQRQSPSAGPAVVTRLLPLVPSQRGTGWSCLLPVLPKAATDTGHVLGPGKGLVVEQGLPIPRGKITSEKIKCKKMILSFLFRFAIADKGLSWARCGRVYV